MNTSKVIKTILELVGVASFLFIWGTFGALDHNRIGLMQGLIQSGIGLCGFLGSFALHGYLN